MVWQHIIRQLIHKAATDKFQEMAEAARTQAHEAPTDDADTESPHDAAADETPKVCHVGIVFASRAEAGSMIDRLSGSINISGSGFNAVEGGLHGRRVLVVQAGEGPEAAAAAAKNLIEGHQPQWVIAAGFAGGLKSELHRGDIVMADSVINETSQALSIDLHVDADEVKRTPRFHVGQVVETAQLARDPVAKRKLGQKFDAAVAADNNSFAIADVCRQSKVRALVIRVMRDAVDDHLPADLRAMFAQETAAGKMGAFAGALLRRPGSVKDMWKLKEDALTSADRLAKFLDALVRELK